MAYQPKSYRKFLATSVAAALVATSVAPAAFAAEAKKEEVSFKDFGENHRAAKEVYTLVEEGVIGGFPDGTFRPDAEVTRAQAALMLARSLGYVNAAGELLVEVDADAFSDLPEGHRAYNAVAALRTNKKIGGFPDGTFRPDANITRGAMAIMVANAYELEATSETNPFTDLGASSAAAVQALYDNKITTGATATTFGTNANIKRSDFSVFTYRGMVAAGLIEEKAPVAPVTELKVESVSANNLKEVVVTFNQEVDVLTGEDVANYTFNTTSNLEVASAVVTGNVVTLTVERTNTSVAADEHAAQQQVADLTIQNVESAKGAELAKVTNSVRFIDVLAPEVVGIKVAGPRQVTVVFSEPLKSNPSYKFDGGTNTVVTTDFTVGAREVTLTLGSQPTEGLHTVEVEGGSDYANFKVDKVVKEFNFVNDTAAPVLSVKSATPTTVVLVADENFVNATNSNVQFYHTVKGSSAYRANVSVSGREITLTFATPIPEGNAKVFLHYVNEEGTKIQDAWGNKVASGEFAFNLAIDRTAPTVSEDIVTVNSTTLRVTFSEAVTNANVASNYELKDADGNILSINRIEAATQRNAYNIILNNELEGGTYTLKVKNGIVDVAGNKLVEVVKSFFAEDKKAPTVTGTAQRINDKKVKVLFSESMDAASITNKANYFYNSSALNSAVTITPVDNNSAVILDFTNVTGFTAFVSGDTINVGRVSDAAGNLTARQSTPVSIPTTVSTLSPVENGVKVVAKNRIEVTFNQIIRNYKASDFLVADNTVSSVSDRTENGKTTIILTLGTDLATDATPLVSSAGSDVTAENTQGIKVGFTNALSIDKLAPELALVDHDNDPDTDTVKNIVITDSNGNGVVDTITVTFTETLETLTASSTAANYATVEGFTVARVVVSGTTVVLTVAPKTGVDGSSAATPTVTLKNIADAQGNLITELSGNAFFVIHPGVAALAAAIAAFNAEVARVEGLNLVEANYTAASWTALETALAYDVAGKTVAQINTATQAITNAETGLVMLISSFASISNLDAGQEGVNALANAAAVIAELPTTIVATLADGSTQTLDIASWNDTDGYANTEGSYTFTATVTVPAGLDLNGQTVTAVAVVAAP
ncbi:S-layer homology domain-containing protein [Anaerobacillus isosaccharinicus]|uniref:S-layer homology domain-containing protein n=1 Tax=Anaerobacillus isosaccharinicus TaxID=1532552 RepID=A0A1S2LZQ8_9BACI|nr:S-layer homology domain-containing protein [Anaerobacillus isosaccharinicus]MBA5584420.1 S-layer homology domain-containing protein [Anaerobacillus isosaccharinicus]QOY37189.1 S-layer homology domain-containing protein [Anaerobacillus isosaccharinicus]